ncbi:hypothetical protein [Paenibacillus sp. L3-i20]|uniref:hypothetical protein n=1 Tax=Paenibacillus sp. L3-i20 TaxID=2905833 RepID=UPI001EDFE1E1|nr:hypothetical protein [Paenibacillus sp. L3-i20]GKU77213.1 hypothetical protein L3i20_v216100 [Paenibacillus sp. L3-i20]
MGRSFANLQMKSSNVEKTIEALRKLNEVYPKVLGRKEDPETNIVMYVSQSKEESLRDKFVKYEF